jgi:hypothetical protein
MHRLSRLHLVRSNDKFVYLNQMDKSAADPTRKIPIFPFLFSVNL